MSRILLLLMTALPLSGCGDGSETFALPDGCYYSVNGHRPVLKIERGHGLVLPIDSAVREVRVSPRAHEAGAYLEVTPGFYLKWPSLRAMPSGRGTARFRIESRERGSQVIMVPLEGASEEELRLGPFCGGPRVAVAPRPAG